MKKNQTYFSKNLEIKLEVGSERARKRTVVHVLNSLFSDED